jgi:hypothetical protein
MNSAHTQWLVCIVALAVLATATPFAVIAKDKIPIRNVDELPRHTYAVTMKVSELLQSDEAMADLMAKMEKNLDEILETYEIEDRATLQGYYSQYYNINVLRGKYDDALKHIAKARELEEKPAQRLMMGVMAESYVKALGVTKDTESDAFKSAYHKFTLELLEPMPWDTVEDLVQQMRGQMQMFSTQMLLGVVQAQFDPAVEKAGFLSGSQAAQLLNLKTAMDIAIPMKDAIVQALSDKIAMHQQEKKDNIWPAREVTLSGREGYSPVVVGVWDAGVDTDVFKDQLFTNPREKADGEDNDGNGYIDDLHGIAYDLNHDKTTEALYPLGPHQEARTQLEDDLKGFFDVNAAVSSPEADAIKKRASSLQPSEVKEFFESLSLYAYHAHGTHVAGISLEGNPYAKLMAARVSFDHHMIPMPFTKELCEKFGKEFREATSYFTDNDVRVVNMSWGLTLKEIEGSLEANGIGATSEERGKMAREMFSIAKKDLEAAFRAAPNVLFVGAAGNSDTDVEFDGFIPSAFELPNLLITGAVDQAGEATGFTSHGRTVEVYANGFEVDSYVPGGRRMALSGTSMAAPNVTNLAAKLLARDPSLKPEDVIRLIKDGAEDFGKDKPMMVINPKRSMELLEKKLASKSG